MFKLNNTKTTSVVLVVAIFVAIMTIGPVSTNIGSASAHYGVDYKDCKYDEEYYEDHEEDCERNFDAHDDDEGYRGDGNAASQEISQKQSSKQNSQCVSGDDTNASCNNLSFQNQENSGNNALAQQ
ncbi:MAG: hypothetical protein H0X03_00395 [Nitrosopumilus sp.]|nr:hypothetical protein [Nitrosopumilus sp.]